VVTFVDSPNLGRSATTNSNGEYRFENVTSGNANLSAVASGFIERRGGVFVNGTNTLNFTLEPAGPQTAFGPGTWLVGSQIAPGRYYASPGAGCEWERYSASGNLTANERLPFDAVQIIVDILTDDRQFRTNTQCGPWFDSPRTGMQTSFGPGTWLVNSQIAPGEYEGEGEGCYWERLSGFRGDTGDIREVGMPSGDGPHSVTISSSDTGFRTNDRCGTWTPKD
jgi:hypothetical protein